jgi:hypothetical protein
VHVFERSLLILLANGRHTEVRYTSTPCNFGGSRLWFICPECDGRVLVLYVAPRVRYGFTVGEFVCRRCANLCYPSQLEDSWIRPNRAAAKVRRRLGGESDLRLPFPPKPKGMHWATYQRWRQRELAAKAPALEWPNEQDLARCAAAWRTRLVERDRCAQAAVVWGLQTPLLGGERASGHRAREAGSGARGMGGEG